MSANDTSRLPYNATHHIHKFESQIAIPSYLIAIAAGDLQRVSLGKRVGIISEPTQLPAAKKELEELESYLDKVEEYMGIPYVWGQYNILVLPPSFPFGGMENPLLTFVSPTMIAGDKSQVATAIHEVAHSWTGNLVTCKNWNDFWLNESLTVFIQRKITSRIYGAERANSEALIESFNLQTSLENMSTDSGLSKLHPSVSDMQNTTPDHAKSAVQYEKGFQLLHHLETLVGEQSFQQFLQAFINKYAQKSADAKDFTDTFEQHLKSTNATAFLPELDWNSWIYTSGAFPVKFDFSTTQSNISTDLAEQYAYLEGKSSPGDFAQLRSFSEPSKLIFLDQLRDNWGQLDKQALETIDQDYNFTASQDPKIKQRWLWLGLVLEYAPVFEKAHEFIRT